MLRKEYTCPKCSKTVSFADLPLFKRRTCPHCGVAIMDWDSKPDQQQHSGSETLVPPKVIFLVLLVGVLGIVAYFILRR